MRRSGKNAIVVADTISGTTTSLTITGFSVVTRTVAEVARFPTTSVATANNVCSELGSAVVFHGIAYGALSSTPRLTPSAKNSTENTAELSDALAETALTCDTVLFAGGEVIATLGGIASATLTGVFMSAWISSRVKRRL